jgi:hypothetical protein
MWTFANTDEGLVEFAKTADTIYGFAPADPWNLANQMHKAIHGRHPTGADPVEVCVDDIICFLAGKGYDVSRGEERQWQIEE